MHTLVPDVLEDEGVPTRPEGTPDAPSRGLLMEWREVLNDGNARDEIEGSILELQMRDVPDLEVDARDRIPVVVDGILGDVDADDVHPMIAKATRPASGTASDIERPAARDRSASVERGRECTTLGAIDVAVEPARRSSVTDDLGIGNAPALPVKVLPVGLQFLLAPHARAPLLMVSSPIIASREQIAEDEEVHLRAWRIVLAQNAWRSQRRFTIDE